ncbi:MAG: hypothetical protein ABJ059_16415 [Hyphomicrobiales bacterium]
MTQFAARKRLTINYPPGQRLVEPHAAGYSSDGNPLVRVYQVSGASTSGEHAHWKLLRADRLISSAVEGSSFVGPRPGYKRDDKAMKGGIIAQL